MAYEDPAKEVSDAMTLSRNRIREDVLKNKMEVEPISIEEIRKSENHAKLIGQLK